MKKLLIILGVIILGFTTNSSVIACKNNNIEQYEINDKGEIIYNFHEKQMYIIGYSLNYQVLEKKLYTENLPLDIRINTFMGNYAVLNINENKAWVERGGIKLIYLK
ncbi:lipoprotein [Spiroplasma sp. AdecLV25b]|uniref:lipoprotein n=1 Tax=Spiroplasma sp. AdecLV25b TaxID=3027162 RepID=UPI0027E079A4|nr:lipoprotein [Spiroplasma sp. AdecLV25b]